MPSLGETGAMGLSSESHQLVGRQGRHTEHQMTHDLDGTLDHEMGGAKFVLEPGVTALSHGTFAIANRLGGVKFDFLSLARVVVNQGDMAEPLAVLTQWAAAVGGVHEIIEVSDPLGAESL